MTSSELGQTSSAIGTRRLDVGLGQFRPVDPLQFPGWDALLATHNESSFFHSSGWARVLNDTYGHRPFYFCSIADRKLEALLPTMEVCSWWTVTKGISLPFADFCPILQPSVGSVGMLFESVVSFGRERGWRYLECRSNNSGWGQSRPSKAFYGHVLDLEAGVRMLLKRLSPAMRRGLRKAEGSGLRVEFGADLGIMRTFYALHCETRRRHGIPPQSIQFFENIVRNIFATASGFVAAAYFEQKPVAAAVFFHQGRQAIYKFGASDYSVQRLRPNNLLMWEAIKHCAQLGCASLHLGRTSISNEGLRRFKLGFGAREERIEYTKYDLKRKDFVTEVDRAEGWHNHLFRHLPSPFLRLAGRFLYPHLS